MESDETTAVAAAREFDRWVAEVAGAIPVGDNIPVRLSMMVALREARERGRAEERAKPTADTSTVAAAREEARSYWQRTPDIQHLNSWSSFVEGAKYGASFVAGRPEPTADTVSEAEAREALVSKFIFEMGHRAACPAHMDRVRNVGPCDCGAETEVNELVDAFEAAIRAERESPQDSAPRDVTKAPIVVGIDAEDEEWMNAPLGTPRPASTDEYDTLLRQYRELEARERARRESPTQADALRAAQRVLDCWDEFSDQPNVADCLSEWMESLRVALGVASSGQAQEAQE